MDNLRVAYSKGSGLLSWLIRFGTHSNVNHTLFLVQEHGVEMVIGADWNGLVMQTRARWEKRGNRIHDIPPLLRNIDGDGIPWLLQHMDITYDYEGLFGMPIVLAGVFWFHRRWKNPLHSRSALFCSESAANMFKDIKYSGADKLDPPSMAPNMLRDWQFAEAGI